MPLGLMEDIWLWCQQFGQRIDEVDDLLTENRIWKLRTEEIGVISAEDALNMGFRFLQICLAVFLMYTHQTLRKMAI